MSLQPLTAHQCNDGLSAAVSFNETEIQVNDLVPPSLPPIFPPQQNQVNRLLQGGNSSSRTTAQSSNDGLSSQVASAMSRVSHGQMNDVHKKQIGMMSTAENLLNMTLGILTIIDGNGPWFAPDSNSLGITTVVGAVENAAGISSQLAVECIAGLPNDVKSQHSTFFGNGTSKVGDPSGRCIEWKELYKGAGGPDVKQRAKDLLQQRRLDGANQATAQDGNLPASRGQVSTTTTTNNRAPPAPTQVSTTNAAREKAAREAEEAEAAAVAACAKEVEDSPVVVRACL